MGIMAKLRGIGGNGKGGVWKISGRRPRKAATDRGQQYNSA